MAKIKTEDIQLFEKFVSICFMNSVTIFQMEYRNNQKTNSYTFIWYT